MSIKIGDNNKINKSNIGHNKNSAPPPKNFFANHPFITGVFISMVAGFIMLFSFWEKAVKWIENLIK